MTAKRRRKTLSNASVFNSHTGPPSPRCYVEKTKKSGSKPSKSDAGACLFKDDRIRAFVATAEDMRIENASGFPFQLLDALPMQIFVKDRAGHYVYLNAKALEYLGYPHQNPIGKLDWKVIRDSTIRKRVRKEDLITMNRRLPRADRELWTNNLGDRRTNKTWRFPIFAPSNLNGLATGVAAVGEDITASEFENAAREIATLVTHDWMNGFLAMLVERFKTLPKKYSSDAEELLGFSDTMEFLHGYWNLLRHYLSPAPNSERGEFPYDPKPIDLRSDVFESIRAVVRTVYPSGPSIEMDGSKPTRIRGDKDSLRVLFFQLYKNHRSTREDWRFADDPLRIEILPRKSSVEIRFISSGVRIADKERRRILQVMKHGVDPAAPRGPRSGFGLIFCERVVSKHGGRFLKLWYDNARQANCFSYLLPRK